MVVKHNDSQTLYDLIIIGGGINGAGIAADAAGRGLSVALVEQNDFASATSSWSSKLIHGGLRYLEHYEFRLVREALAEREVLLNRAPHIIQPQQFVLPHHPGLRPAWLLRMGLWLYDNLNIGMKTGDNSKPNLLKKSRYFSMKHWQQNPLKNHLTRGFFYSDCFVDDSRLVIVNAMEARKKGAYLQNYTRCTGAQVIDHLWHVQTESHLADNTQSANESSATGNENSANKQPQEIIGKHLINAAGPWVQSFIEDSLKLTSPRKIRLIKGSHILIPKLYEGEDAFILQNNDNRIVFVIPYREMTLVGTTDVLHTEAPETVAISQAEKEYLIDIINQYFKHQSTVDDILFDYSGVRPLCDDESDDPSAVTRDYTITLEEVGAPLINIFGGKLTTFRKLAESVLEKLKHHLPSNTGPWTANQPLPGGDLDRDQMQYRLSQDFPWLDAQLQKRFITHYGSLTLRMLEGLQQMSDMGENIFADLYAKEIEYLVFYEFAKTAEDILWRRTKLGYKLPQDINLAGHDNEAQAHLSQSAQIKHRINTLIQEYLQKLK